jgi:hypothetical protein
LDWWLDPCQDTALEFAGFLVGDSPGVNGFSAASNGDPILARPFFDVLAGQNDAELVAFPSIVDGRIDVTSASEMQSASLLLRKNLRRGPCWRADLLGGYRFFHFREALSIREQLVSTDPGGLIPLGTTFDLLDRFVTHNEFHGGEIGLATEWGRNCWSLETILHVALGNVHESVAAEGRTDVTVPQEPTIRSRGGLLALPTNLGEHSQNAFAVLPEANVNLHYRLNDRLRLTCGYTFLYLNHVFRTGDQVDLAVNPSQIGGELVGPARPAVLLRDSGFWAQGLSFGADWQW